MIVIFSLISAFSAAVYVILRTMPFDKAYEFFQFIGEMRIVYFRPLSMISAFGTALGDKHCRLLPSFHLYGSSQSSSPSTIPESEKSFSV